MGLSLSYLAVTAAGATLIIVAISMASKAKQKKAAAAAVAATNVSQTGQEGTVAATAAGDAAMKTGIEDGGGATKSTKSTKSIFKSATKSTKSAKKPAFNYTLPPEFDTDFGLFGPEDPADPWVIQEPPKRLTQSILTEAETAKFRGHVKAIFDEETISGRRIIFHPDDVVEVMKKVAEYLEKEPMLIEDVPYDITVVADLHGQLYDLDRIFRYDAKDGKPGWECMKYLFLGDYVDRGRMSLEIVMGLFCLKMLYPDRIFLLKGNHEFISSNCRYGFYTELSDRYLEETADALYLLINFIFGYLSAAAIVGGAYFCAHGGVSTTGFTRRNINSMTKPVHFCDADRLLMDIVWSDPAKGLQGTIFNNDRGASSFVGLDDVAHALYNIDCKLLIRGHTYLEQGYDIVGSTIVSLFSATGNSGRKEDDGAVAHIAEDGKLTIIILKACQKRIQWERQLKRYDGDVEGEVELEKEEKTTVAADLTEEEKERNAHDPEYRGKMATFNGQAKA